MMTEVEWCKMKNWGRTCPNCGNVYAPWVSHCRDCAGVATVGIDGDTNISTPGFIREKEKQNDEKLKGTKW